MISVRGRLISEEKEAAAWDMYFSAIASGLSAEGKIREGLHDAFIGKEYDVRLSDGKMMKDRSRYLADQAAMVADSMLLRRAEGKGKARVKKGS